IGEKAMGAKRSVFFVSTGRAVLNPDPDSVLAANAVFFVKDSLLLKKRRIRRIDPAKILGVDASQPELSPATTDFLLGIAQQSFHFGADVDGSAGTLRGPGYVRCACQNSAKSLLAAAKHVSRLLDLGDVFHRGHIASPAQTLGQ